MLTTREMFMLPAADDFNLPVRRDAAAILLAIAPLFVHLGASTHINGRLTSYADFADIALGVVLLLLTFRGGGRIGEHRGAYRALRAVISILLVAVAVLHIASGSGFLLR